MGKRVKKKSQQSDNLSINANWDDIINLSVREGVNKSNSKKQKVTPAKKAKK